MDKPLAFEIALNCDYARAIEKVSKALQNEGFGILTRIDVKETLKQKLGVDFRPYVILGACNPPLAHRALAAQPRAGLLLPCNVTVEAAGAGSSMVRIGNPEVLLAAGGMQDEQELCAIGNEARDKLQRVADALSSS